MADACQEEDFLEALEKNSKDKLSACLNKCFSETADSKSTEAIQSFVNFDWNMSGGGYALPALLLKREYNLWKLVSDDNHLEAGKAMTEEEWERHLQDALQQKKADALASIYQNHRKRLLKTSMEERKNLTLAAMESVCKILFPDENTKAQQDWRLLWAALILSDPRAYKSLKPSEAEKKKDELLWRFEEAVRREASDETLLFDLLGGTFVRYLHDYLVKMRSKVKILRHQNHRVRILGYRR